MTQPEFVLRVLRCFAEADDCDSVWWRTDDEYAPVTFLVSCNDFFWWGCADAQPITPDNVAVLEQAYADCRAIDHEQVGPLLFVARARGLRPQGCCYPKDPALWPFFDACGPKRDVDFGNPHKHPADGGEYAYKSSDV